MTGVTADGDDEGVVEGVAEGVAVEGADSGDGVAATMEEDGAATGMGDGAAPLAGVDDGVAAVDDGVVGDGVGDGVGACSVEGDGTALLRGVGEGAALAGGWHWLLTLYVPSAHSMHMLDRQTVRLVRAAHACTSSLSQVWYWQLLQGRQGE